MSRNDYYKANNCVALGYEISN